MDVKQALDRLRADVEALKRRAGGRGMRDGATYCNKHGGETYMCRACDYEKDRARRIAEAKDAVIQELLQCETFHAWPDLEAALRRLAEAQEE